MSRQGPFEISQDMTVVPPKAGRAYPIPLDEWTMLKGKCKAMSNDPWFFHSAGFLLLGASLSTLASLLAGAYARTTVAWAVFAVTAICGSLCLYFAHKERGVERTKARDIVTHMEIIESRYDLDTHLPP